MGQEALPPHDYTRWSFREILGEVGRGPAGVNPQSDGFFHLSDMARFLRHIRPLDTAQTGPFSWRNLLLIS